MSEKKESAPTSKATTVPAGTGNPQTLAKTPKTRVDELMSQVALRKVSIEGLLPPHMKLDKFVYQVRLALEKQPKLQGCTPQSIVESVLQAADLGLDPSGRLGSAWLVPFRDTCQLIPGYRGLIDLAVRSGEVAAVFAAVVHEKDQFEYFAGRTPKHKPYIPRPGEPEDPGTVYAAYATITMLTKAKISVVMTRRELDAIKVRSPSLRGGGPTPWKTDEEEMQKKTVIRRALKLAPLSPVRCEKLVRALELDPDDESQLMPPPADVVDGVPVEHPPAESTTQRLLKRLQVESEPEDVVPPDL